MHQQSNARDLSNHMIFPSTRGKHPKALSTLTPQHQHASSLVNLLKSWFIVKTGSVMQWRLYPSTRKRLWSVLWTMVSSHTPWHCKRALARGTYKTSEIHKTMEPRLTRMSIVSSRPWWNNPSYVLLQLCSQAGAKLLQLRAITMGQQPWLQVQERNIGGWLRDLLLYYFEVQYTKRLPGSEASRFWNQANWHLLFVPQDPEIIILSQKTKGIWHF